MKRILFSIALCGTLAAGATTVNVSRGNLRSILSDTPVPDKTLKLVGSIDARDLAVIDEVCAGISVLDLSDVTIPAYNSATPLIYGVRSFAANELPAYTFFGSPLTEIILPSSLKRIGDGALAESAIRRLAIPAGVETIGDFALRGCTALASIDPLPASVQSVGREAFAGLTALPRIDLSKTSVSTLPAALFRGSTALCYVYLPSTLTHIGEYAFADSGVQMLAAARPVTAEPFALAKMNGLMESTVSVTNVADTPGLYYGNAEMTSVAQPGAVLPDAIFAYNSSLNASDVISNASQIGNYALAGTRGTTLYLPETLTSLADGVLAGATEITDIDAVALGSNVPAVTEHTFDGIVPESISLKVARDTYADWAANEQWGRFKISGETSVAGTVATEQGYRIGYRAGEIHIAGAAPIMGVTVHHADGRLLAMAAPGECEVSIPVSVNACVVVIAIRNAEKEETYKLYIP